MGVLDQVKGLKKEGLRDEEISAKLQEQGVSPSSINDAFNQMKVKEAIDAEDNLQSTQEQNKMQNPPQPGQLYTPRTQDVETSGMNVPSPEDNSDETYYTPQNYSNDSQMQNPYPETQEQTQQYYPQYYSGQGDEYSPQSQAIGTDTDTMIEIAEQVFTEKTKKMQKQLDMLSEFANIAENKIANNNERIKRIEKIIDNLQIKILEKVSSYGENIDSVKKEMSMMQESFSKVLPKLAEAHEHTTHHKTHEKK